MVWLANCSPLRRSVFLSLLTPTSFEMVGFQNLGVEVLRSNQPVTKHLVPVHVKERPVSIGTEGEIVVRGQGIGAEQLFIVVREGRVYLARAEIVKSWTAVDLPCRVQIGDDITIRIFWCVARPKLKLTPPKGIDLEGTRTIALPRKRTLPPATPPPRRPTTPPAPFKPMTMSPLPTNLDPDADTWQRQADGETLQAKETPFEDQTTMRRAKPAEVFVAIQPPPSKMISGAHPVEDATVENLESSRDETNRNQRNARGPISSPTLVRPVFVPMPTAPVPDETQNTNSTLFQMATRAINAWNRFVDDMDARRSPPRVATRSPHANAVPKRSGNEPRRA